MGHLAHARILYAHLIASGKHRVDTVAMRMGIAVSTLYSYCEGRVPFPLHRLGSLYAATQDVALLSELIGCADLGLTLSVDPAAGDTDSVKGHALALGAAAGAAQGAVVAALADGKIDRGEEKEIAGRIEDTQRVSETLAKAVRLKAVG